MFFKLLSPWKYDYNSCLLSRKISHLRWAPRPPGRRPVQNAAESKDQVPLDHRRHRQHLHRLLDPLLRQHDHLGLPQPRRAVVTAPARRHLLLR
ncbi:hypothetical protein CEXT_510451 [Caerostris extrusa]|uniref:Uncharacterized protein n=1 Tax=Caerostris extrusa TaxID=172846 RepID=A0AAV4WD63_CAEEX|nr:hypothetical protein CEXT_510451 [Caerostris extrusa]